MTDDRPIPRPDQEVPSAAADQRRSGESFWRWVIRRLRSRRQFPTDSVIEADELLKRLIRIPRFKNNWSDAAALIKTLKRALDPNRKRAVDPLLYSIANAGAPHMRYWSRALIDRLVLAPQPGDGDSADEREFRERLFAARTREERQAAIEAYKARKNLS